MGKISSNPAVKAYLERDAYYVKARHAFSKRYTTFDPVSMELLFNLLQAFNSCATLISAKMAEHGITLSSLNILSILLMHGEKGCALNQLSRLLLVSRANITGVVDGLVRKGYVIREDDPKDRRIIYAKITKVGERWLDHYLPGHYQRISELLAGITLTEKKTLSKLLYKLRHSSCLHPSANCTLQVPE